MLLATAAAIAAIAPATASADRPVYVTDESADQLLTFGTTASGSLVSPPASLPSPNAEGVVVTPDGKYVYVADSGSGGVRGYGVGAGGALTALPGFPVDAGSSAYGLTVTADGKYLYVADNGTDTVAGLAVGSDGSLTPLPGSPYATAAGSSPFGVAASPDSKSLYVVDSSASAVESFTIAADGSIAAKPGPPLATGSDSYYVVVTPDSKFVYIVNYNGDSISGYAAAGDGSLSPLPGSPFPGVEGGYAGMAVSADSTQLFVTSYDGGTVDALAIGPDGTLTPIDSIAAGDQPNGLALAPDGKNLYTAAGDSQDLFAFAVAEDGTLVSNGPPADLPPAGYSDFQSVAMGASQPPVAAVTAKAGEDGVTFDASTSTDPDGTVASYAWNFGDGKTETTTVPTVTHAYEQAGGYTATVTLTDDEGCSSALIYTGQATLCNGSGVAVKSVEVDAGVLGAKVTAKGSQKQKGTLKVAVKAGAEENVELLASGSAKFKGVKGKVALKKAKGSAEAGKTKTLKLKAKKKAQGKAVVGAKGKAKVSVKLTDEAGNVVTKKVSVKLK
jgi:6-phosphogluconolactonase (cycloisomerase 2 family)